MTTTALRKFFFPTLFSFLVTFGLLGVTLSPSVRTWTNKQFSSCPSIVGYYNGSWRGTNYSIGAFEDDFKKCKKNPILAPIPSTWESRHVKDPYAIKALTEPEIWLYYAATNGEGQGYMIGVAFSTDRINFNRYAQNPLLKGSFPVVVKKSNYLIMYYSNVPRPGISYAISYNGLNWEEKGIFLNLSNRILIPGDVYEDKLYFGERQNTHDVMRYVDLRTGKISDVLLDLQPCSVTPRGVINETLMYPTLFGCEENIKELVVEFKDGEVTEKGLLGLPNIESLDWDAASAENITWIREY